MNNLVTGRFGEAQPLAVAGVGNDKKEENVLYQTSLMSALLSGVYEGKTSMAMLKSKGSFGLGTFNRLDGEMIAFDGNIYQLRSDGSAQPAEDAQMTPFAVMTFFRPQYEHVFDAEVTREEVHQVIDGVLGSDNQLCALRISGLFTRVETRTVPCQCRPYRSMPEVLDEQPVFSFSNRKGELVGFRTPQYLQGINVAGYHEHYITDDRQGGGHILNYTLANGMLTFGTLSRLVIDLPHDGDFLKADLSPENLDSDIRAVES